MTESKRTSHAAGHTAKRAAGNGATNYASMMAMNNAFMEATSEAFQSYMKAMMSISEALLSFATSRIQCNLRTSEELMRCRALPDAMRVQQEWLREASDQYINEATKIVDIATQSTIKGFSPLVQRSAAAFEREAA
jgi:hypothetical protein